MGIIRHMKTKIYSVLIKRFDGYFVAFCPELNVAAQGESLVEGRKEIAQAIRVYIEYSKKTGITSADLDIDTLREFLLEDIEQSIRLDKGITFSENFATSVIPA